MDFEHLEDGIFLASTLIKNPLLFKELYTRIQNRWKEPLKLIKLSLFFIIASKKNTSEKARRKLYYSFEQLSESSAGESES